MSKIQLPHHHNEQFETIYEHMPQTKDLQTVSDIFKQLSDNSWLLIFWLLCHVEECVINISAIMEMSRPAVSRHLKQLKAGKLIVSRRERKEMYSKYTDMEQAYFLHPMLEKLMEISCPES